MPPHCRVPRLSWLPWEQGQVVWVFVSDPQKGPSLTGWCPRTGGGILMVFSLTTQGCSWWGAAGTSPAEGFCD